MNKNQSFRLFSFFFTLLNVMNLQAQGFKTETGIFSVKTEQEGKLSGNSSFWVYKSDLNGKGLTQIVEESIPNKNRKEVFYPGATNIFFEMIGDKMIIVYDVWNKSTDTKDCFVRFLDTKTVKLTEAKPLYSTKLQKIIHCANMIYQPVFSPDKTKVAILKDYITIGENIEPEIKIYDANTFNLLKSKKISSTYENNKRFFDNTLLKIGNNGDISLVFHLVNEKTKVTTKSYSADIPFSASDLQNIKNLREESTTTDNHNHRTIHGYLYKNMEDFVNEKPIPNVRIKNNGFSYRVGRGTSFLLVDDEGNQKDVKTKNLPGEIFTYKESEFSEPYAIRIIDDKPYIILIAGKLSYYALYLDQEMQYYSEGWNGELKKFRQNDLEEYLKKYNLLANFKKDKPKREFKDTVNDYFNKTVDWYINYFKMVNKMIN